MNKGTQLVAFAQDTRINQYSSLPPVKPLDLTPKSTSDNVIKSTKYLLEAFGDKINESPKLKQATTATAIAFFMALIAGVTQLATKKPEQLVYTPPLQNFPEQVTPSPSLAVPANIPQGIPESTPNPSAPSTISDNIFNLSSQNSSVVNQTSSATVERYSHIPNLSDEEKEALIEGARLLGVCPDELFAVVAAETNFDADEVHPKSGAATLFQLLEVNAQELGYTLQEIKDKPLKEQILIGIESIMYKRDNIAQNSTGEIPDIYTLYGLQLAPAYSYRDVDAPYYSKYDEEPNKSRYDRNKNIDLLFGDGDGTITKREAGEFVMTVGRRYNLSDFRVNPGDTCKIP